MSIRIASRYFYFLLALFLFASCNKDGNEGHIQELCIVFINDPHGQIEHFPALKHLIDQEEQNGPVIVASCGDIFSGNPIVDKYPQQGYPMIDLMNASGFDISTLGNHEFDYGLSTLEERLEQSAFPWICANVDMQDSGVRQLPAHFTLEAGGLRVVFLGLIETNGKADLNIPSTHPAKVQGIHFDRPELIAGQYEALKEAENADLLIALTHLGHDSYNGSLGDFQLAHQFPFFDLIIGGHTKPVIDTLINDIPVFHAGLNLEYAGVIRLRVKDKALEGVEFEAVDLANYPERDEAMGSLVDSYRQSMLPFLEEVIGYSEIDHNRIQAGCFYTDALRAQLGVDMSIQNYGGIRAELWEGDITVEDIYRIDPFNNGSVIYSMTVAEIKDFLKGTRVWHCYSGVEMLQSGGDILIYAADGTLLAEDQILTLGINDYIPAVDNAYFPDEGDLQELTTAEQLIEYLKNTEASIYYPDCPRFFKFQ